MGLALGLEGGSDSRLVSVIRAEGETSSGVVAGGVGGCGSGWLVVGGGVVVWAADSGVGEVIQGEGVC